MPVWTTVGGISAANVAKSTVKPVLSASLMWAVLSLSVAAWRSGDGPAVHPGSVGAGIARDPVERHKQRRRVTHEVEQIIEPAATIGRRPMVKFGLHPRYPRPRPT